MRKKNFNRKLFTKVFLGLIAGVAIISPIAFFATARDNISLISAAGSSAVFPLVNEYASEYKHADIVSQAGGSGVGIQSVIEGTKNIGMASKNPNGIDKHLKDWTDRKIKTITISWDGLGIVYRDPSENPTLNLLGPESPSGSPGNIFNIYKAFAGNEIVRYHDIGIIGNFTPITPFARTGGATASGTADSFFKSSGLISSSDPDITPDITNALGEGNYGRHTFQTPESNSQSWQQAAASSNPGAMVYLSAGFIANNKEEILAKKFKVATYQGATLEIANITKTYNWFRPLNVMISLLDKTNGLREFIEWTTHTDRDGILKSQGYIPLSEIQKNSMKSSLGDFWVDDVSLGYSGALENPPSASQLSSYQLVFNNFHLKPNKFIEPIFLSDERKKQWNLWK